MKSSLLVKTFLVFNLLLCIGVTGFGVIMFQEREVVKARTVLLKEHVQELAEALAYGEQQEWEQETQGTGPFSLPSPQTDADLAGFTASLDSLESVASTRVEQLGQTYTEAQERKATLAEARQTLSGTEATLASTRTEVANLENDVSSTTATLRETQTEATTLKRTVQTLTRQVEDLDLQSGSLQEQISGVRQQLELRTGERDRVEELLAACRQPRNEDGGDDNWHQKTARILEVEPNWNYVIIDKGEVDVLPMFLEAFVHRGEEFVGKIRVMQVENTVALAEILTETMTPGMQLQSGDTIFF